jgi:hypothetical protein
MSKEGTFCFISNTIEPVTSFQQQTEDGCDSLGNAGISTKLSQVCPANVKSESMIQHCFSYVKSKAFKGFSVCFLTIYYPTVQ